MYIGRSKFPTQVIETIFVGHVCMRDCKNEAGLKNHLRPHSRALSRVKVMEIKFCMKDSKLKLPKERNEFLHISDNYI